MGRRSRGPGTSSGRVGEPNSRVRSRQAQGCAETPLGSGLDRDMPAIPIRLYCLTVSALPVVAKNGSQTVFLEVWKAPHARTVAERTCRQAVDQTLAVAAVTGSVQANASSSIANARRITRPLAQPVPTPSPNGFLIPRRRQGASGRRRRCRSMPPPRAARRPLHSQKRRVNFPEESSRPVERIPPRGQRRKPSCRAGRGKLGLLSILRPPRERKFLAPACSRQACSFLRCDTASGILRAGYETTLCATGTRPAARCPSRMQWQSRQQDVAVGALWG
ncbi:hypothetical protein EJ04DRAFT_261435 [Polyplosphaeria fusca]|uniref:Uncharacterized protein n=1 Tax=Polyplosphaeria fusca TaxID=682080 RepID=A0A9P4RAL7_9PLEO|nr:hypothetical protein EJ04DRAFT_261435 [Polyplosphaeria fusca]